MSGGDLYAEMITLPRAVRFPVELIPPPDFAADDLRTWPQVVGRLEYREGRLLYMPPCGEIQQFTVTDVVITLGNWVRAHPEFLLGTNEAGMRLQQATRAADAAIWRRVDVGRMEHRLARVPPLLAVEVAGQEEDETMLRDKAAWYLSAGVQVVWIVLPEPREVLVLTPAGERRCRSGEPVAEAAALPGLMPAVDDCFRQITG